MKVNNIFIGIDPGKKGFITVFHELDQGSLTIQYYAIPMIGNEVDLHELDNIIKEIKSIASNDIKCVLEDVHAIYGSAAGATFTFGFIAGAEEMCLISNSISYTKVKPKKWQKEMWEGVPLQQKKSSSGKTMVTDTKKMSEIAAKRLFPNEDLRATTRCKKSHDGKVDALLMVEYCKRHF